MNPLVRALGALLLVAALVLPTAADGKRPRRRQQLPAQPPAPAYVIERLDDGLTLVVVKTKGERVALRYGVRAGGLHDPEDKAGTAHFVSRLVLQGGHSVSAGALEELARKSGARLGAHAHTTWTTYALDAPKDTFLELLERYVGMLTNPALEFADVERERQLAAAEGAEELSWLLDRLAFPSENRGRKRLGSAASREALHIEELVAFYERHYTPANTVVLIVGDVEVSVLREVLGRAVLQPPVPAPKRAREEVEPYVPAGARVKDERTGTVSAYALGDVDSRVCEDIAALLELRVLERVVWRDGHATEASVRCERLRGQSFVVARAFAKEASQSGLPDVLKRVMRDAARRPPSASERRVLLSRHATLRSREQARNDELADALARRLFTLGGSLEENLSSHFRAPTLDWSRMRPVMEYGLRDERRVLVHLSPR